MPAHNKSKTSINLLVQEGFEHTTFGKILTWLLSAGRTIVIVTELVVITAFLSRFWLDKTLTDLSEANNSKKAQIEANAGFEQEFKSAQIRLAAVKQIDQSKLKSSSILKSITSFLPQDVKLADIAVNKNQITVHGRSETEAGIAGFINAFDASSDFKNTALSDLALDTLGTQTIKFTVKTELSGEKEIK